MTSKNMIVFGGNVPVEERKMFHEALARANVWGSIAKTPLVLQYEEVHYVELCIWEDARETLLYDFQNGTLSQWRGRFEEINKENEYGNDRNNNGDRHLPEQKRGQCLPGGPCLIGA